MASAATCTLIVMLCDRRSDIDTMILICTCSDPMPAAAAIACLNKDSLSLLNSVMNIGRLTCIVTTYCIFSIYFHAIWGVSASFRRISAFETRSACSRGSTDLVSTSSTRCANSICREYNVAHAVGAFWRVGWRTWMQRSVKANANMNVFVCVYHPGQHFAIVWNVWRVTDSSRISAVKQIAIKFLSPSSSACPASFALSPHGRSK